MSEHEYEKYTEKEEALVEGIDLLLVEVGVPSHSAQANFCGAESALLPRAAAFCRRVAAA